MVAQKAHKAVPFGDRYVLTQMLAVGGMAEIYLGYREVALGLSRPVVIKRLKPELSSDQQIVRMFMGEARLATVLSHPLVVQSFDVGEEGGVPFIAMEYIRGEELNGLARRGLQVGHFMPRPLAVEIIRQAAVALGYCHSLRDELGAPLELVHCDVSPNNLLVSEDGFVKLIDFGIAHFASDYRGGEAAVPGKLSYMSPEQVLRSPLDHRSDIFSLGVILYEMTLGRRLFRGPAMEVRDRIARADVEPPTFVDHDYPGFLEGIVMKALEPAPSDRYHSAYELADELAQYLVASQSPLGAVEVARYIDELSEAAGQIARPELWSEPAEEDALDFDRGFSEEAAAPVLGFDVSAWDEYDEGIDAVAEVLGIDVSLVRSNARPPTSEQGLFGRIARAIDELEDDSEGSP